MDETQNSGGLFGAVDNWVKVPFRTSGSALNWVLFVGLLIVAVWFWQTILLEISREV